MFKLKVSVLFALLILLAVLSASWVVEEQRTEAGRRHQSEMRQARDQFRRELRLREMELRDAATALAQGPIRAYVETLDRFREDLEQVEADVYDAVPLASFPLGDPQGTRLREAFVQREKAEFLDAFLGALADTVEVTGGAAAWESGGRAEFIAGQRATLVTCAAYAAENCRFRFTFFPLRAHLARVRHVWDGRAAVDLAVLADRSGVGLADAANPVWSADRELARRHPVVTAAARGEVLRDVIVFGDSAPSYYLTIAAPVLYGRRVVGSTLVGTRLDEHFVRQVASALGTDVTLLHGTQVVGSTISVEATRALVGHGFDPSRREPMDLTTDRFLAVSLPFVGNFSDDRLHAVLSVDLDRALAGYRWIQTILITIGVVLLLVGLAVIQVLVQSYSRQFERIDAGIHEVIGGNRDYTFSFDLPDTLASNMAQSLNLMVAVLEGKPLPDELGEAWDESLLIDANGTGASGESLAPAAGSSGGAGSRADVGRAAPVAPEPRADDSVELMPAVAPAGAARSTELLAEPAESYYRRLYREYLDARRRVGDAEHVERITYPAFVEKLARNERRLKEKLGCRNVRFEVAVREQQVLLTPIPIP
jgi:hypothetical protein